MKLRITWKMLAFLLGFASASCVRQIKETPMSQPSEALALLCADYWDQLMARYPEWATMVGDHRFDDRLTDLSHGAHARHVEALDGFLARLRMVDSERLGDRDRATWAALEAALSEEIDEAFFGLHLWRVDPLMGPQVDFPQIVEFHPKNSAEDFKHLGARYRAFGTYIDQYVTNLRSGLAVGKTAPKILVQRAVEQTRRIADSKPGETVFDRAAKDAPESVKREVARTILPVYRRLADFLEKELLPKARTEVGINALPDGEGAYRHAIRVHTGGDTPPQELNDLGRREVERIEKSLAVVAERLGHSGSLVELTKKLSEDPALKVKERAALVEAARTLVGKAEKRLPELFGRLPKTPLELKPIEGYREQESPAAYYYAAPEDGSRPAIYYVNTFEPESRPLYNFEALTFHEAVPGHHLQVALGQEIENLPKFRQHGGPTAFVEGWALYAEGLSEEIGLYSDDRALVGRYSYELWRACRLVVDTGLHHLGWTREQAISYLVGKTGLPEIEARNEVDRYIAWPGQALAYKVGELEIRRLRAAAKKELGEKFDLRAFHDHLLGEGALPLSVVRERVKRWTIQVKAASP